MEVLVGIGVGGLLMGALLWGVISALERRAYRQGAAEAARRVLETDHAKQAEMLEALQAAPPSGPALAARWRARMRKRAEGDPDPPVS